MSIKIDLRISPWKFYELHGVDGKASAEALTDSIYKRLKEEFPNADIKVSVGYMLLEDELTIIGRSSEEEEFLQEEITYIIESVYDEFEWIPLEPQTGASKVVPLSSSEIMAKAKRDGLVLLFALKGVFPAMVDLVLPSHGVALEGVQVFGDDYGAFVPMARGIIRGEFPERRGIITKGTEELCTEDPNGPKRLLVAAYEPKRDTLYVTVGNNGWAIAENVHLYFIGLPPDWQLDTTTNSEEE